eukprot:scaffold408841_cov42-Prasinocladus_malaysianus.AAC.1
MYVLYAEVLLYTSASQITPAVNHIHMRQAVRLQGRVQSNNSFVKPTKSHARTYHMHCGYISLPFVVTGQSLEIGTEDDGYGIRIKLHVHIFK